MVLYLQILLSLAIAAIAEAILMHPCQKSTQGQDTLVSSTLPSNLSVPAFFLLFFLGKGIFIYNSK